MNARKSLVKFFGPVLLLTASLALPADTMAAPGHGRQAQAAHVKAENHKKQKQNANNANRQQRQQQARAARQSQVRQERQRVQQRQRHQQVAVARQKVVKQKVVKQKAARPVVVQQSQVRTQRQLQAQRQLALQQQRQAQLQRQSQIRLQQQRQLSMQRQAQVRQRNTSTYRNRNRYHAAQPYRSDGRRGRGGADPNVIDIDGYLSDEGSECLTLRGHDGRLWSLPGNTYGLQPGEHVRLVGRIVDGGACGWQGTAFDIYEVTTVWADDRHRTTYYDHLYDGPFDQLGQSGDTYNGPYDDRSYDPYNNGGVDIPYRHNGN